MNEQQEQAQTFVQKLNAFAARLEPHEQAMLVSLTTDDDVTGFGRGSRSNIALDPARFGLDPKRFGLDPAAFALDPAAFGLDPEKLGLDPGVFGID